MAGRVSTTGPTVETLSGPPSLAGTFLKAVVSGRGRSGRGTLPETALELADLKVDRDDLAAYQQVCGMPVSDTLPHTYPHVLGFPLQADLMARPGFPLPLVGLVHLENVITVRRRLTAADAVTITVHAEDLRPHPKGMVVDLVTAVSCDGEPVWHGRSTYLSRGRSTPDAPAGAQPPEIPKGAAVARWRLPGDLGRTYAGVSGDVNPIHLYPLTAKALGFPRAIAHGMWTYARTLAALGPAADGPSTSHVWFRKPVLLPGSVELVVEKGGHSGVTAGLRSARTPSTEHLILTLDVG
jgi:acyl dehydratase